MKIVFLDGPLEGEIEHDVPADLASEIGKIWKFPIGGVRSDHPLSRGLWYWYWTDGANLAYYEAVRFRPGGEPAKSCMFVKCVKVKSGVRSTGRK